MKRLILTIAIAATLIGCSTSRYYSNTSHAEHDTIRVINVDLRIDSVWRDRIHTVEVKGDTVYLTDSITVEKWKLRTLVDTMWKTNYTTRIDSVYVETPSVIHERSKYDIFTSYGFWILLAINLIAFILVILYFALR